uniref:Movement protein n=1 Tax=Heterorhabditis bacteriophora TaxID=37862 RepID=A0A1I7XLU4_HETBA
MDELQAIIIIVVLCCLMFLAWLVSMATCPDTMVSFLSGSRGDSNYSSSHESKELITRCEEDQELIKSVSSVYLQLNNARRASDKKLSVVPEADEQLTVQSTINSMRPSILRIPSTSPADGVKISDIPNIV